MGYDKKLVEFSIHMKMKINLYNTIRSEARRRSVGRAGPGRVCGARGLVDHWAGPSTC